MEEIKKEITPITTRVPRAVSERGSETRVAEMRDPIVFGGNSRFNVPSQVLRDDPDHVYGFVVYSSGNTEQKENYYEAMDRGWKPVSASEHPSLARNYSMSPFKSNEAEEELIRRGGQILMKRTVELQRAEDEHYDAEKQRQDYMAEMYRQVDPRYPKPFMDSRTKGR